MTHAPLAIASTISGLLMNAIGKLIRRCYLKVAMTIEFKIALLTLGFLALGLTHLNGDDKSVLRQKVEELIRDLDAKTLIDRSHAERELLELGPEVLSFLPAIDLIEGTSARDAIRRIRPHLERQAARESSAPFPISLKGTLKVEAIIKAIQSQSKNKIVVADDCSERLQHDLTIDWDQAHFWDCIDELCRRASLSWKFEKDTAAIRVFAADQPARNPIAVDRAGAFRVEVQEIERRPVIGDERHKMIRVDGRISVEPRLRPLFLFMAVENLKALADDNQLLAAWSPGAKFEYSVGDGGHEVQAQWDFLQAAAAELKTLSIRGRLRCQIAAATEPVVFDQNSQTRGTIRRRGGVTVRLREVNFETLPNDQANANIGITVSYDTGGPAFESHRSWIFHNAVYLETKTGVKTPYSDFEIAQQADGAVAVDYRWRNVAGLGSQYLFVYEAPTLIIDVPIDFAFKEIDLKPAQRDPQ